MRLFRLAVLATILAGLQACAVHPVQQDVTGLSTVALVNRIRCEEREAIETKAIELLTTYNQYGSAALAQRLRLDRSLFQARNFRSMLSGKEEREFYDRYIETAIALNFTFDITEDNKAAAQVDLLKPLTNGMFSLALGVSGELSRENSRRFLIHDTFEALLTNEKLKCDDDTEQDNIIYPITGRIGLYEVVSTFVDLNESDKLDFLDKTEVFADTLTFLTTFGGSANPKISLTPIGRRLQVMDAPLSGSVSRMDKHSVIIGLSLGNKGDKTARSGNDSQLTAHPLISGPAVLALGSGTATQRAIEATFLQRFDTFLDRFSDVVLRQ